MTSFLLIVLSLMVYHLFCKIKKLERDVKLAFKIAYKQSPDPLEKIYIEKCRLLYRGEKYCKD